VLPQNVPDDFVKTTVTRNPSEYLNVLSQQIMSRTRLALIIKELSYGDTGISTSAMCNDLANIVIAQHGSDTQKSAFLGPFVEKPILPSFCLTEPGAGSDNSSMTTFIKKGADGTYLLNGSKCFITNASHAS
jgi:acyl-CoA dehydrogenase